MAGDKTVAAAQGAGNCVADEAGQNLRPPKACTWARRGHTPVVAVSGKGSGRVSMAGLVCIRPGHRSRLCYRLHVYHGRTGERKGLAEADYAALLTAVRHRLGAPIVLVWDKVNIHTSAAMRGYLDEHADWRSVYRLPGYAPELDPTEGVWANVKTALGNLAARGVDALAATAKTLLKRIQYRPGLIDGFIAETVLIVQPG